MTPDELREIRERLGLTQTQLADLLETTQESVSRWETGVHRIPPLVAREVRRLERKMAPEAGPTRI